jgi:hypothetical protein
MRSATASSTSCSISARTWRSAFFFRVKASFSRSLIRDRDKCVLTAKRESTRIMTIGTTKILKGKGNWNAGGIMGCRENPSNQARVKPVGVWVGGGGLSGMEYLAIKQGYSSWNALK